MTSSSRYTYIAKALHWLMAIPIIVLLLLGQHTMGDHGARFLPTVHASAGFVLLAMVAARLWWRFRHPPPPALTKAGWETLLAKLAHGALYVAMFLIPLTGWVAYTEHVRRSLGVRPASLFGVEIPLLPDLGINWHFIHKWGGKAVLLLIALHIAAALKHHFIDKDGTLKRMTWGN